MPWRERRIEQQRMEFVQACKRGERSMSDLCREFGISRKTGYAVLERYATRGAAGLYDTSRRPHSQPNATPDDVVSRILQLRRRRPTWGSRKLRGHLRIFEPDVAWPARSTFDEILTREGLVHPRSRRRRFPAPTRHSTIDAEAPNDSWSIDFKGWFRVGDGTRCDPLTVTDNFSRYLLLCRSLKRQRLDEVQRALERTFREYGIPQSLRSDNGSPFASRGIAGLSRFGIWLVKLGIRPDLIAPGKPQENGRHERMHRTLKAETATPPRASLRAQQEAFNRFQQIYNFERPHEALGDKTPAMFHTESLRPFPRRMAPVEYDSECIVRSVRHNGCVKWDARELFLGLPLVGEHVAFTEIRDNIWKVSFSFIDLAILDGATRRLHSMSWIQD